MASRITFGFYQCDLRPAYSEEMYRSPLTNHYKIPFNLGCASGGFATCNFPEVPVLSGVGFEENKQVSQKQNKCHEQDKLYCPFP